jgi:hypothetical protein
MLPGNAFRLTGRELQAEREELHLPAASPTPIHFPTPLPGTPHRLKEMGKTRSGAVLSGLLDPIKTRTGPFVATTVFAVNYS